MASNVVPSMPRDDRVVATHAVGDRHYLETVLRPDQLEEIRAIVREELEKVFAST